MTQQHILVLSSWYPNKTTPHVGNFIQRQAKLLASKFKITVLHTKSDESIKDISLEEHKDGNFREIIIYHPKGKSLYQKFILQKKAFKMGLNMIEDVSLVHAHIMLPKGLQFITAKKYYKCPLIVSEQGSYFRPEARKKRTIIDKITLFRLKKHIDQLTTVSEFSKKDLLPDFPNFNIKFLPNHINIDLFVPKEKEKGKRKEFLHISTLDERLKNPKGIIDACLKLVEAEIMDFHLIIICDENAEKWKKYVADHQLSNFISFYGAKKWEELAAYYQQSDAFILFSNYETFSIVLAEAWACGIPTITPPVGIGYNLPDELGIQVEIKSVESLSDAMKTIISEEKSFDSSKIRSHAIQYSEDKIISTFEEISASLRYISPPSKHSV